MIIIGRQLGGCTLSTPREKLLWLSSRGGVRLEDRLFSLLILVEMEGEMASSYEYICITSHNPH